MVILKSRPFKKEVRHMGQGTAEGSISLVDTLKLHGGPENRGEKLAGQRDVHNAVL